MVKLTVYTKTGCPECVTFMSRLDARGLNYRAVDIEENVDPREHKAAVMAASLAAGSVVPIILVEETAAFTVSDFERLELGGKDADG